MKHTGLRRTWTRLALAILATAPLLGAHSCIVREDYRDRIILADESSPRLRVALVEDAPSLALAVPGPFEVRGEGTGDPLLDGVSQAEIPVVARDGKIVWDGTPLDAREIRVVPRRGGSVKVAGTLYRGTVRIRSVGKGAVSCINEIGLETYLAGVLGAEVPTTWPDAALQAQAIAARTYALHRAWQRRRKPYDLTADTLSQVYRGLDAEDQTAYRIVYETEGVILVYGDKIFSPFYMSICGGHTASASKVFGGEAIQPLQGGPCGYCRGAPRFRWPGPGQEVRFSEAEIVSLLRPLGLPFDGVDEIEPLQTEPDGYAGRIALRAAGKTFTVSGRDFRMALGPNRLLSAAFDVVREEDGFSFQGQGWGHGVGMCQWGVHGMARTGHDARQILEKYYPGASLVRVRPSSPSAPRPSR